MSLKSPGFGLLEVLITVLIFSVGLLGVAALQAQSKRANFEAMQRTVASVLANDIIDRIRANPDQIAVYAGNSLGSGTITAEPATCASNDTSAICRPKMAAHDRWEWEQWVDSTSGLAQPTICIANNANVVTVTISWRGLTEITDANSGSNCGTASVYRRQLVASSYIDTTI